jgi:hypothetical protein
MTFTPGHRPSVENRGGGALHKRDRMITRGLVEQLSHVETSGPDRGRKQIDLVCRAMVKEAKKGNVSAFKVIADRVEGAVKQDVDLNFSGASITKQLTLNIDLDELSDLYYAEIW